VPAARDVIASNLRTLREIRRLGQQELAERVGLSRRTIARLENAEVADPGIEQVSALAAALGVTVELLTRHVLVAVRIPVPEAMRDRLDSPEGPALLERVARLVAT
jgi:transcriptional regulator with XRE-family HTH domain